MQKVSNPDLFNTSDLRDNLRITPTGAGSNIRLVSSTASKVYAFAVEVIAGVKYKVVYTIVNIISTNGRQACVGNKNSEMIYYSNLIPQMREGYNEFIFTAKYNGYLWMTVDKNVTDIHCYKV